MKALSILALLVAAAAAIPDEANVLERRCRRLGQYCDRAAFRCCGGIKCCGPNGASGKCVKRDDDPPNKICF
ncbi:hypothetical protein EsDP_00003886 [Epichloe bromicola]|uniref:Uncharacterized protein n=1 Tax=Epichloe bromicola TaxID=79588 RepID=A0ABQ0CQ41_9HYPO